MFFWGSDWECSRGADGHAAHHACSAKLYVVAFLAQRRGSFALAHIQYRMASAGSSSGGPSAPAGAPPPRPRPSQAPPEVSGIYSDEQEELLGGYQWRFLWLGVVPSSSPLFAPAGESTILGHHGLVAWAQPDGDEADPDMPLGILVRAGGTNLRVWAASHIAEALIDSRGRRSEFTLPGHEEFQFSLDAMAITMRVWPGNAYPSIGASVRLLFMVVQPAASAPAGQEDTQEALSFANRDMLAWVRRTLGPLLQAERTRQPRFLFHSLCAGTSTLQQMASDELGQHVCHAIEGPCETDRRGSSHVGSGIMVIGPHVKLGGRYADPHACEEAGESSWPMLPGPLRCSYSEVDDMSYPAIFMGQSRRMREAQRQKKRRTRVD